MATAYEMIADSLTQRLTPNGMLCFSDRMAEVYCHQMQAFTNDQVTADWRSRCSGLYPGSINDELDVAAEMGKWFPTHYYKILRVLIRDFLSQNTSLDCNPFGASDLTILDIGAGVGTASLAIVDTIALWQQIAVEHGYPPLKTTIRILPVESDDKKTSVRDSLYRLLESRLPAEMLRIEHLSPLEKAFVEDEQCVDEIVRQVGQGHLVLCVFSNILNWIKDLRPKWYMRLLRSIGLAQIPAQPYLHATTKLLNELHCCRKVVISSETSSQELGGQQRILLDEIRRNTNVDRVISSKNKPERIDYRNQRASYYDWLSTYWTSFYSATVSLDRGCNTNAFSHCQESTLHQGLNQHQLRVVWSKARYEVCRNPVVDEVHSRLMETNLDWYLERLTRSLSNGSSDGWFQTAGFYLQPKPGGGSRVTALCSISDAVAAVILLWGVRGNIRKLMRNNSHAYRLEIDQSEFLYEVLWRCLQEIHSN